MVAELPAEHRSRMLSVRPGRYFVRARGPDVMYEGTLEAVAGTSAEVELAQLQRTEYARLVRKGARASQLSHGPELGLRVRSPLPNTSDACIGGYVGYGLDFADLGVGVRLSGCESGFERATLEAETRAFDVELWLSRAWDVSIISFDLGLGGGVALFSQRFRTPGRAPARDTAAPFVALGGGVTLDLSAGYYVRLELAAETYFLRVQDTALDEASVRGSFALRPALGVSKRL